MGMGIIEDPAPYIILRLSDTEETRAIWPHKFELYYKVSACLAAAAAAILPPCTRAAQDGGALAACMYLLLVQQGGLAAGGGGLEHPSSCMSGGLNLIVTDTSGAGPALLLNSCSMKPLERFRWLNEAAAVKHDWPLPVETAAAADGGRRALCSKGVTAGQQTLALCVSSFGGSCVMPVAFFSLC
jgi:hypothetical protein